MNGDNLTKEELLSRFLQIEQRVEEVEQENAQLREKLKEKGERIKELETYDELRRVVSNNEMISRAHAVPAVETSV